MTAAAAPVLFVERRSCICCEAEATPKKRVPGEPNIIAVNLGLYRRGEGKRVTAAAGSIQICETCLIKALAAPRFFEGTHSRKFLAAIRERLSARYSAMLEADRA